MRRDPEITPASAWIFASPASAKIAVLGLRALYFALEGLVDRFVYLHYGLAAVLVFLGAEFVLQGFGVHLPIWVSLVVIASIVTISIVVSLIATRGGGGKESGDGEEGGNDQGSHEASETDGARGTEDERRSST